MPAAVLTAPDLIGTLDAAAAPVVTYGTRPGLGLDAPTLDALLGAIDDRIDVAPVDELLELHRGRRALELELATVLDG